MPASSLPCKIINNRTRRIGIILDSGAKAGSSHHERGDLMRQMFVGVEGDLRVSTKN